MALGAGLGLSALAGAAPRQAPAGYVWEASWPEPAGEPVAVAALADGGSLSVRLPRRSESAWPALTRREADGTVRWRRVARDEDGTELRPLAVAAGRGETLYLATERRLVWLDGDGQPVWGVPAGDPHPDFGPAARGLALSAAGDLLFGLDLVRSRLLGYRADTGALRLRLGTAGPAPGSYLSPQDVAVLPGGELVVADYGNRRLQLLDAAGNPLARWPLAGRPRAVAVAPGGRVLALLDDETVRVLGTGGVELGRFGGLGRADGRFQLASDLAVTPDGRVLVADRANGRLQRFRPAAAGETPAPEATAWPGPTAPVPEPRELAACPGRPAELALDVAVPPAPRRSDVLLLLDTTGSMESLLSTVRTRLAALRAALGGASADVAVGLLDVRDYPYGEAALAADWPWLLRAPISADPSLLEAAVAELWSGGGGDAPEAYAGALAAALDDPRIGWRPGARRFIVLLGDAVPRDLDLNVGVDSPDLPSPWAPGRPATWRDSGADWAPATADDPAWPALLDRLRTAEVTLLVGVTGVAPLELAGNPAALVRYWQAWAARAGPGSAAILATDLTALGTRLGGLVGDAGRRLERLEGVAGPGDFGRWVRFEPAAYTGLDVPPEGLRRTFSATIAPPPGTAAGRYSLALDVVGDGAVYAAVDLTLDWRDPCAPSPSAPPPASATPHPTSTQPPSPSPTQRPTEPPSPPPATRTRVPPTAAPLRLALPIALTGHCFGAARLPADIALLLDVSSSMRSEGKLEAALAAASGFVGRVDRARDQVALVTFHANATVVVPLTRDVARLQSGLAEVATAEGTRLDRGLEVALAELSGPRARSGARRVIVLLTDGRPDAGSDAALEAASRRIGAAGILVLAIGLGADVDAARLIRLAGAASRYYPAPTSADLDRIYREVAAAIPCG